MHAPGRLAPHSSRGPSDAPITIRPFSLRVMVVCGLAIFCLGFFSSRYGMDFTLAAATPGNAQSESTRDRHAEADVTRTTGGAPVTDPAAPAVVHVVMRNMKFDPATLEVKRGDVVEWKNEDITPHTATSASFDSGSIDPDKSWRHTFGEPGNFPYACTFHPDMKAVVTVK